MTLYTDTHNTAIDVTELHEVSDLAVEQKLSTQHD